MEDSYNNILIGNNIGQDGFQIPFEMILLIFILSVVVIGSLSILIIVKKRRSSFGTKEKDMKEPGDLILTVEKEEEHKHTIFISYSTLDSEYYQIEKIVRYLNKYPEIDKVLYWEKDSKENIVEFMDRTLEESDVFILFCSESSIKSTAVRDEWQAAFQRRKKGLIKIIPVYENEDYVPPLLGHLLNVKYTKDDFKTFLDKLYREILR